MAATGKPSVPPIPVPPVTSTAPVAPIEAAPVLPPAPAPAVPAVPAVPAPAPAAPTGYAPPTALPAAPTSPYQAPASGYGMQPTPAQGLSIASLVCGLSGLFLSIFALGFLPAVAAVITGHLAAKRQPLAKGYWLTGLISGYIGIVISVLIVLFWVFFLLIVGISARQSF